MQQIVGRHRHHRVQLEVAALPGQGNGGVIADYLSRHLNNRFGNDRVDLAGHYGTARLHFRHGDFAQAGPGAAGDKADVVGDFVQADRDGFQFAAGLDHRVQGGLGLKVIVRFPHGDAGRGRQPLTDPGGKLRMGVDAGADRRAA